MQKNSKNLGFTLVELIVVITILAILGTIGFISLVGFQKTARESVRISDINTIAKALEFFYTQENFYPNPTDLFTITFSGSTAWNQGTFGSETQALTRRISKVPRDPLTDNEYAYSTTNTKQEYQLGAISESLLSQNSSLEPSIFSQAYAENNFFTNIKGNYNKQIVTVRDSNRIYILGVPTIITSEITGVTVQEVIANKSFALRNSGNLPGSYAENLPEGQSIDSPSSGFTSGLITGTAPPLLYEGTIDMLDDDAEKQKFADNLVSYYQDSNLTPSNVPGLDKLLNPDTGTPENALAYVKDLITRDTGGLPGDKIEVINIPGSSSGGGGGGGGGTEFITVWKTDNPGDTASNQIRLPIINGGTYNFTVDWENDGIIDDTITSWNQAEATHTYPSAGTYTVVMDGVIDRISFTYYGADKDPEKILDITQWGTALINPYNWGHFRNTSSLTALSAVDEPDLSSVTSMDGMFMDSGITSGLDGWDVSNVSDMNSMFRGSSFNGDIGLWDVSNVENFSAMFSDTPFNQDIHLWDISQATDISYMFSNSPFDQDIHIWDAGNATQTSAYEGFDENTPLTWISSEKPRLGVDYSGFGAGGGVGEEFITVWNTSNSGESASNQIMLPLIPEGTYNFTVDWENDGTVDDTITSWDQAETTHTYGSAGTYTVVMEGEMGGIRFPVLPPDFEEMGGDYGDPAKLLDIEQWGSVVIGEGASQFQNTTGLTALTASDSPNLSLVTDASYMFQSSGITSGISGWDTTSFEDMRMMFESSSFNGNINSWNVSNVVEMEYLFSYSPFNQDLSGWTVSNVEYMNGMFSGSSFNQDISGWDVSNVYSMRSMFETNSVFDQDISGWNVSNVDDYSDYDYGTSVSWTAGEKPTFP